MPPAGHNRSAAGCEATGGTGRILVVRALAPHTDSRGGTLSARCREGTCNPGRAGTGQVPSSALFCGDNRQTHLGGRGPPGCSGERDRWLPLGGDDLNKRTRVSKDRVISVPTSLRLCVYASMRFIILQININKKKYTYVKASVT